MKITRSGECTNSPKNAFVEDFAVDLLAAGDLSDRLEETASLPNIPDDITEIEIAHAISHGKIGAANGTITADGSKMPFALFIEFASVKATTARQVSLYSASSG